MWHRNSTIEITGKTIINVRRLKIDGVNPDRLEYTVREYFDPEGCSYEIEHIPTGIKIMDWTSNGLGQAVEKCKRKVEASV